VSVEKRCKDCKPEKVTKYERDSVQVAMTTKMTSIVSHKGERYLVPLADTETVCVTAQHCVWGGVAVCGALDI
jgi:hypothetical protein